MAFSFICEIMRKIIIKEHTDFCSCEKKKRVENSKGKSYIDMYYSFNNCNYISDVFMFENEFIYIEYPDCVSTDKKYEFIYNIINSTRKNPSDREYYLIDKAANIDSELKDYRIRGIALREYHQEINYLYWGGRFGQEVRAVTTVIPFMDIIDGTRFKALKEDAEKLIEFLSEKKYSEDLIKLVNDLVLKNSTYISDFEVMKTTEYLVKELNKKIKNK